MLGCMQQDPEAGERSISLNRLVIVVTWEFGVLEFLGYRVQGAVSSCRIYIQHTWRPAPAVHRGWAASLSPPARPSTCNDVECCVLSLVGSCPTALSVYVHAADVASARRTEPERSSE